jgi:hypothetical protein
VRQWEEGRARWERRRIESGGTSNNASRLKAKLPPVTGDGGLRSLSRGLFRAATVDEGGEEDRPWGGCQRLVGPRASVSSWQCGLLTSTAIDPGRGRVRCLGRVCELLGRGSGLAPPTGPEKSKRRFCNGRRQVPCADWPDSICRVAQQVRARIRLRHPGEGRNMHVGGTGKQTVHVPRSNAESAVHFGAITVSIRSAVPSLTTSMVATIVKFSEEFHGQALPARTKHPVTRSGARLFSRQSPSPSPACCASFGRNTP